MFLWTTFVLEPILIQTCNMNANIMKPKFFYKMNYDLQGH